MYGKRVTMATRNFTQRYDQDFGQFSAAFGVVIC